MGFKKRAVLVGMLPLSQSSEAQRTNHGKRKGYADARVWIDAQMLNYDKSQRSTCWLDNCSIDV